MLNIKIINKSNNPIPKYQTSGSAGLDLYAFLDESIVLKKNEIVLVPTGIYLEIPIGYEVQIRSRSSLALKNGIFCLNSPGTIDSDYRGEIKVILASFNNDSFIINNGDRIAQMVFSKFEHVVFNEVDELSSTERGEGGFGSTNV